MLPLYRTKLPVPFTRNLMMITKASASSCQFNPKISKNRGWAHLDTVLNIKGITVPPPLSTKHQLWKECHYMNQAKKVWPSLAEIEREVVAESREWGRQRLQERLQQLADEQGEVFPPGPEAGADGEPAQRIRRGQTKS